jgi:hypothetical protein
LISTQILRQNPDIESNNFLAIGNICLASETNPKALVEEATQVLGSRDFESPENFCNKDQK